MKKSNLKKVDLKLPKYKDIKFELAPIDKSKELDKYIQKVVRAFGHKGALVTDESYIIDLTNVFDDDESNKQIERAKKKLRVDITTKDLIWQVAERLKNHEN